jgi:GNAT superfamily N-acetyltransferase
MDIAYSIEENLNPDEFLAVLVESTLGERRPIQDRYRIEKMCENANLILTARHEGRLVGVARCLTDFAFCTYLSDLAVSEAYQRKGIGKELIRRAKEAVPETILILLAAPKAMDYYPHIGMTRHEGAFFIKDAGELRSENQEPNNPES